MAGSVFGGKAPRVWGEIRSGSEAKAPRPLHLAKDHRRHRAGIACTIAEPAPLLPTGDGPPADKTGSRDRRQTPDRRPRGTLPFSNYPLALAVTPMGSTRFLRLPQSALACRLSEWPRRAG